jgi:hypothetical protein
VQKQKLHFEQAPDDFSGEAPHVARMSAAAQTGRSGEHDSIAQGRLFYEALLAVAGNAGAEAGDAPQSEPVPRSGTIRTQLWRTLQMVLHWVAIAILAGATLWGLSEIWRLTRLAF